MFAFKSGVFEQPLDERIADGGGEQKYAHHSDGHHFDIET
jgi:hypothetical protein